MRVRDIARNALFVVALMSSSTAFADWKTYEYAAEQFSVEFPDVPGVIQNTPGQDSEVLDHIYEVSSNNALFSAALLRLGSKAYALPPDQLLRGLRDSGAAAEGCEYRSDRPIAGPGTAAREFISTNCSKKPGRFFKANAYLIDDRVYLLVFSAKLGREDDPDGSRFLSSFRLKFPPSNPVAVTSNPLNPLAGTDECWTSHIPPDLRIANCTNILNQAGALHTNLSDSLSYRWRAFFYMEESEYPKALADYDKVITLAPGNLNDLLGRAVAYANLGDYRRATQDIDQAAWLNLLSPKVSLIRSSLSAVSTGLKPASVLREIIFAEARPDQQ
jgi:tetratricopeptide (TPR) repeat protein